MTEQNTPAPTPTPAPTAAPLYYIRRVAGVRRELADAYARGLRARGYRVDVRGDGYGPRTLEIRGPVQAAGVAITELRLAVALERWDRPVSEDAPPVPYPEPEPPLPGMTLVGIWSPDEGGAAMARIVNELAGASCYAREEDPEQWGGLRARHEVWAFLEPGEGGAPCSRSPYVNTGAPPGCAYPREDARHYPGRWSNLRELERWAFGVFYPDLRALPRMPCDE